MRYPHKNFYKGYGGKGSGRLAIYAILLVVLAIGLLIFRPGE